ncbi:unnamed protein product [Amoebophrya sp. A120]|nr:unnamed protein product [Amoebophrya sp. A120]|eukprot:GSA120T00001541001.1
MKWTMSLRPQVLGRSSRSIRIKGMKRASLRTCVTSEGMQGRGYCGSNFASVGGCHYMTRTRGTAGAGSRRVRERSGRFCANCHGDNGYLDPAG